MIHSDRLSLEIEKAVKSGTFSQYWEDSLQWEYDLRNIQVDHVDFSSCAFINRGEYTWSFAASTLWYCNFEDCGLEGVSFEFAELRGCDFRGAFITECDFKNADLRGCNLFGQNLYGCNFKNADLRGCDLREVFVGNCSFEGADLRGADLGNLWVREGQAPPSFEGAKFDEGVRPLVQVYPDRWDQ